MNEQLQAALADLLGKANSGIDAGATFLQAQLPDVIQQLLVWKAVMSGMWFSVALLAFIALVIGMSRHCWSDKDQDSGDKAFVTLIACIPAVTLGICIVENLGWLQIWLAPKVYLIEYAASLAK